MQRLLSALIFIFVICLPLSAQTQPDVDDFFPKDMFGVPKLSPSGRYVAVPDYREDTDKLAVFDLQNDNEMTHVDFGDIDLAWVSWGTDERILAGISLVQGVRSKAFYYRDEDGKLNQTFQVRFRRIMAMDRDGKNQSPMFSNASHRMKKTLSGARIINTLASDPDHILMSAEDKTLSLWKVNIHNGEADLVEKGTTNTYNWQLNNEGVPVVRLESIYNDLYAKISVRAPGEKKWQKVINVKLKDVDSLRFVAPTDSPTTYYVSARPEGYDRASIFKYDLKSKSMLEQVSSNEKVDIYSSLISSKGNYYGTIFFEDRLQYDFIDPALNSHMDGLDSFFNREKNVFIQSSSANGEKWLLNVEGPGDPGSYYTYDRANRKVEYLLPGPIDLNESDLGKMRIVEYAARDGMAIRGYLTKPAKPKSTTAPLIVMPHGGPHARDYYEFNQMAQFLTTRGYQVFQPNFRGSAGFGESFKSAGYGEWGGKMQDDITDGVKYLIATGEVNADQICIVGASYGGYAALIGASQTPNIYKCSVSINGVTDLLDMLKYDKDRYGASSDVYEEVRKTIGDPKKLKEAIKARSPVNQISDINIPVLLIHGSDDRIVPVRQSRDMYARLSAAGKSVDYFELSGANHNLSGRNSSDEDSEDYDYAYKQTLLKLESFLAVNLKP